MEITLDTPKGNFQIRSYESRKLRINDQFYTHSVIVSASQLIANWPPQTLAEITREHLRTILDQKPEVVLIGTGPQQLFPNPELLSDFMQQNIGVEIMDTAAACRTFNVLTAEERNVVAALLL